MKWSAFKHPYMTNPKQLNIMRIYGTGLRVPRSRYRNEYWTFGKGASHKILVSKTPIDGKKKSLSHIFDEILLGGSGKCKGLRSEEEMHSSRLWHQLGQPRPIFDLAFTVRFFRLWSPFFRYKMKITSRLMIPTSYTTYIIYMVHILECIRKHFFSQKKCLFVCFANTSIM